MRNGKVCGEASGDGESVGGAKGASGEFASASKHANGGRAMMDADADKELEVDEATMARAKDAERRNAEAAAWGLNRWVRRIFS
jgi:hypothetical protein